MTLKTTPLVQELQYAVLQVMLEKVPAAVAVQPVQTVPM